MNKITIGNIRLGHATNSSSSHSMVFIKNAENIVREDWDGDMFGWDFFTLSTKDSKIKYLAGCLFRAYESLFNNTVVAGLMVEEILGIKLLEKDEDGNTVYSYKYEVDHQSMIGFPSVHLHSSGETDINQEFIKDFIQFMKRSDVVILGGNDNSDESHYLLREGESFDYKVVETNPKYLYAKKQGDWWCLYNKNTGAKTRFSFLENPRPLVKADSPELVDLKVTDFCTFGCEFCVPASTLISTPNGDVAIEQIHEGDRVFSVNIDTKEISICSVKQTFKREYNGNLIEITTVNNNLLQLTPEHEVWTENRGWIKAKEIQESDILLTATEIKVKTVKQIIYNGFVYNIGTPPFHNYIANGVLVHNCYQDSTKNGKHADMALLHDLSYNLANAEVWEVALGGGEATLHPYFYDIVKDFKERGITVNFTTKNKKWLDNEKNIDFIIENIGAFAFSVESVEDIDFLLKSIPMQHLLYQKPLNFYYSKYKTVIQYVMGSQPLESFEKILEKAAQNNFPITLLGYKTVGRGHTFQKHPYQGWMKIVENMYNKYNNKVRVSIDTALAAESKDELVNIPQECYQVEEGKFSMYIDAVKKRFGPSSFCKESEYISFKDESGLGSNELLDAFKKF